MRRYCYGWWMAVRGYKLARLKKHGAGPAPRWVAMRMGASYRGIIDGQFCGRAPYYLRDGWLMKIDIYL